MDRRVPNAERKHRLNREIMAPQVRLNEILASESAGVVDEAAAERIATTLNSKYPSHSYPILLNQAAKIGLNASALPGEINALLLELNRLYSEMEQKATTDFDEIHAHGNEILNILEGKDLQVFYQHDKDWFYRSEERRWITMNDNSSWRRMERVGGKLRRSLMHIA